MSMSASKLKDYPDFLTTEDIQKILCIGKPAALKLVSSGAFDVLMIGRSKRIHKESFIEWVCATTISRKK